MIDVKKEYPFTLKVEVNNAGTGCKMTYLELLWIKEGLKSQYKDLLFESVEMEERYRDLIARINNLMKFYNRQLIEEGRKI